MRRWKFPESIELKDDSRKRDPSCIKREFWTSEMWEEYRRQRREKERCRKRSFSAAFGQLKEILLVGEDKRVCQVDLLRLARDKIQNLIQKCDKETLERCRQEFTSNSLALISKKINVSPSQEKNGNSDGSKEDFSSPNRDIFGGFYSGEINELLSANK